MNTYSLVFWNDPDSDDSRKNVPEPLVVPAIISLKQERWLDSELEQHCEIYDSRKSLECVCETLNPLQWLEERRAEYDKAPKGEPVNIIFKATKWEWVRGFDGITGAQPAGKKVCLTLFGVAEFLGKELGELDPKWDYETIEVFS